MLVHQAAAAFESWTGAAAPVEVMEEAARSGLGGDRL
jgi:shikimate 5-dehydrogenase